MTECSIKMLASHKKHPTVWCLDLLRGWDTWK